MCEEQKLEELKKLKRFFESIIVDGNKRSHNQDVGMFGYLPTFFGNVILWNSFDIPAEAMRIIYEHNKDHINREIERLEKIVEGT